MSRLCSSWLDKTIPAQVAHCFPVFLCSMDVKDDNLAGQLTLAQGVRLSSWSSLHTLPPGRHLAVSSREERLSFLDNFFCLTR